MAFIDIRAVHLNVYTRSYALFLLAARLAGPKLHLLTTKDGSLYWKITAAFPGDFADYLWPGEPAKNMPFLAPH